MSNIVDTCPLTKSKGDLQQLHEVEDSAYDWLDSTVTTVLVKWNEIATDEHTTRTNEA